jgi:DNA-binding CsgD family transcriptional regulator
MEPPAGGLQALRSDANIAVPSHIDCQSFVWVVLGASETNIPEHRANEVAPTHLANPGRLRTAIERANECPATAVPLTPREREVLDWVAAGKTNRDIAAILGASRRTIEKHLERIFDKLGVETRTAAVMRSLDVIRNA